ncbi:MAG: hypothetical protein E6Q67_03195 [Roseateles sp.]|nr:MAG: hypothetical protein E6Q67_03195 [Roseateles sp.]
MSSATQSVEEGRGLVQARKALLWMRSGIMPSQVNAREAQLAVTEFMRDFEETVDVSFAKRVLGMIAAGISPSAENCMTAADEVETALDVLRNGHSAGLRERFERMH